MSKKKRLLIIYEKPSSFIQRDIDILQDNFEVRKVQYKGKRDMVGLAEGVAISDVNLSWFALGYATSAVLFSKLLRKKSIVIAGGWDVVAMPEIGYGAMVSEERINKTKFALRNADKVIAVSNSTRKDTLRWIDREVDVVHLGFDPNKFKPSGEKEDLIITVSNIRENTIKLKGLETFVKSAQEFPEYTFAVIGAFTDTSIDYLKSLSPENVKFPGYVTHSKLIEYYQKAKVYAQLSYQESFGSALAEAMLCECIPVVTERGALPEVVSDTGFYAQYDNVEDIIKNIKNALDTGDGTLARKRIMENFPLEKRKGELIKVIHELLDH